ncbi:MAG TPA: ATP-binding cassette domain-containing protein, partial [Vicinamibacterales bacterium]|nr:ATP-binding cassette domain-containing protein [Vicinamibacterales bacterium]
TTRLAADVPTLQRISGDELADGLRFALWGIGGTAMLFYTSAVLSALVLIAMPTLVAGAYMLGGRIKRYTADAQHAYAQTGTIVEESIAGIRTVRAFSQEAAEAARHESLMSAAVGLARRKILATASHTGLSFIIGEGCALLALWVGGHLIINGTLSSGGLISFILYAFLVARGYRNASTFWAELLVALGSTEWVFGVMALEPELANLDGLRPAHLGGAVTFDAVHFSYPSRADVEALAGIDLAIAPGEVVAFVGRSGSGKSTLLNLLLRFYDPTRGRVLVDDVDLRRVDPVWLRGQVGVVMQEPVLFSRSIADNIRYGHPGAGDADVRDAARLAHADEFITRFPDGYATRVGDRGVQLSGGQRQRIAIARAVLRRPPVLMLDEATSALDAESESLVQDAIRGLDYRPTTLIVAHRLSTVVNVDRVVVVDRGRILAAGTHETLLESCEFYRQLVENQLVAA